MQILLQHKFEEWYDQLSGEGVPAAGSRIKIKCTEKEWQSWNMDMAATFSFMKNLMEMQRDSGI